MRTPRPERFATLDGSTVYIAHSFAPYALGTPGQAGVTAYTVKRTPAGAVLTEQVRGRQDRATVHRVSLDQLANRYDLTPAGALVALRDRLDADADTISRRIDAIGHALAALEQ